jgi:hypothetical protein
MYGGDVGSVSVLILQSCLRGRWFASVLATTYLPIEKSGPRKSMAFQMWTLRFVPVLGYRLCHPKAYPKAGCGEGALKKHSPLERQMSRSFIIFERFEILATLLS